MKCCLFGIGIPLTVWLTFNLVSWDLKLSANWNQPSGLKLRARKSLLVRKDKTNYSIEYRGNSPQFGGQCETISEVFNKALVKWYNSTVLNSLGIVSSPEDQKARDEGEQLFDIFNSGKSTAIDVLSNIDKNNTESSLVH